jgi:hypothetical protein
MPGQYVKKVGDTYKQVKRRTTYSGSEVLKAPQGSKLPSAHIRDFDETKNRIKPMEREKMANKVFDEINNMVENGSLSKEAADRIIKKAASLGNVLAKYMKPGMFEFIQPGARARRIGAGIDELAQFAEAGTINNGEFKLTRSAAPGYDEAVKALTNSGQVSPIAGRVAAGVGVVGTALAAQEGLDVYQAHKTKGKMMDMFPELNQEDPDKVERAYSVLQQYAPTLTRDPQVAGSAVAKMVQYEIIDPATVKTLLETQKADNQPGRRLLDSAQEIARAAII